MSYEAINFGKKFKLFDEQWQPKVIAEMNDYQFKIVKLQGDFIWHDHKDTDETFIVQARRWVVAVKSAKYGQRITLTYPVLEASRDAAFLVAGKAKQEVVARVRAGDVTLPAALMRPVGRLHWFTDRNAAPVGAT